MDQGLRVVNGNIAQDCTARNPWSQNLSFFLLLERGLRKYQPDLCFFVPSPSHWHTELCEDRSFWLKEWTAEIFELSLPLPSLRQTMCLCAKSPESIPAFNGPGILKLFSRQHPRYGFQYLEISTYANLMQDHLLSQRVIGNRFSWCVWYACMHAQSLLSCLTLCNSMDRSPSSSSVHMLSRFVIAFLPRSKQL